MRNRASCVKVELPNNNLTKGGHIPHEQKYNTGHEVSSIPKEALIKSARADVERFFGGLRFEKRRNTLCISSFSNRKADEKDPTSAAGDLFRDSLRITLNRSYSDDHGTAQKHH